MEYAASGPYFKKFEKTPYHRRTSEGNFCLDCNRNSIYAFIGISVRTLSLPVFMALAQHKSLHQLFLRKKDINC